MSINTSTPKMTVVDLPAGVKGYGGRWHPVWEQLMKLPAGKALCIEVPAEDVQSLRGSLGAKSTKQNVKVRTSIANGCLYVWIQTPDVKPVEPASVNAKPRKRPKLEGRRP